MTKSEQKQLMALIGKASRKDLEIVVIAYKARRDSLASEARVGLAAGDTVSLEHRKFGGYVKGIITKVKRTRATVEIGLTSYDVPMSMLTKVGA